jgi:multidrug resistance efflux pump
MNLKKPLPLFCIKIVCIGEYTKCRTIKGGFDMNRAVLINILVLIIVIGGGAAAFYYYNQSVSYVSTSNAKIDGQPIPVSATAAGELTEWNGDVGKVYHAGDRIGRIQPGPTAGSSVDITLPGDATIVQNTALAHSFVTPGALLARGFDFNHLWITANIEETRINDVKQGQAVDVYIDAFPGTSLSGRVDKIGLATAGTFSLLPSSNTNANYTKVKQVIPVIISLDGYRGLNIIPGMSASVRIHI